MDYKQKYFTQIKIIIILIIGMLGLTLSSLWLGDYSIASIDGMKSYIIPILLILIMTFALHMQTEIKPKLKNLSMIITKGWYIIAVGSIFFIFNLLSLTDAQIESFSPNIAIYFVITCLLTGVFEEIWFRGLTQNILVDKYEKEGKGALKGIVISSVLFALVHLSNLIGKPYFILGTITQVFYTLSLGIMLGVIYYLSKNILVVILLHGIFNILGSFTEIFSSNQMTQGIQSTDIPLIVMIIELILMLPGILVAYKMYKKNTK